MSIVFENVSYDYNPPAKNKRGRAAKKSAASSEPAVPPALSHIDLVIPDGQFVGVIGHTGSGKSTFIQHMNGLLQPTEGRVTVDGLDMADKANRKAVRKRVGIAFQYPEYQLFATTVAEDVAFGPRNLGVGGDELDKRVRESMEKVGLDYETFAHKSPFHLSGGQQRRVALAGILAMEPQVLVLDEPIAGLDPKGRADMLSMVHELHASGLTVVMVSHSMKDVAENAERVLVLDHGVLVMDGTPQEIFAREEELRRIGLGVPRSTAFQKLLEQEGFTFDRQAYSIDALADLIAAQMGPRTKEQYLAAKAAKAAKAEKAAQAARVSVQDGDEEAGDM